MERSLRFQARREVLQQTHCLTWNLTLRSSRNTLPADQVGNFNQPLLHHFPRRKDRNHVECVSRGRFLVRQPEDFLSCRGRRLTPDVSKEGEYGRSESSNQARITSVHDPTVSRGILSPRHISSPMETVFDFPMMNLFAFPQSLAARGDQFRRALAGLRRGAAQNWLRPPRRCWIGHTVVSLSATT